ncbi:MAG: hypothetical protein DRP08_05070, partial [Candidatus Aenigmatarchaeota archaeon]
NPSSGKTSVVDERTYGGDSYSLRIYMELNGNSTCIRLILYTPSNQNIKIYDAYKALKSYFIYCTAFKPLADFYSLFYNESFQEARELIIDIMQRERLYGTRKMKWLHVEGDKIVNEDGFIVFLYGANYMGMEFGWFNHKEEDFVRMRNWGFNVVRLPIGWHYIEPEPGKIDEEYLMLIDKVIYLAKKNGLYVVLDMHQWHWSPRFDGCGMPDWVVPDAINYKDASIKFFTNRKYWVKFANVWKILAERYRDEPAIAAYDIFNEPMPDYDKLSPERFREILSDFYDYVIGEIRKKDQKHIVMFMSVWGSDRETVPTVSDNNSVLDVHFYAGGTWDGKTGYEHITYHELRREVEAWILVAKKIGKPLWFGEFGVGSSAYRASDWAHDVTQFFDHCVVGYCWWTYWRDATSFGLLYPDGSEKESILSILDRPHVRQTNASITDLYFDINTKVFTIYIDPKNTDTISLWIYIPLRHFPQHLLIKVENAIITKRIENDNVTMIHIRPKSDERIIISIEPKSYMIDPPKDLHPGSNMSFVLILILIFIALLLLLDLQKKI